MALAFEPLVSQHKGDFLAEICVIDRSWTQLLNVNVSLLFLQVQSKLLEFFELLESVVRSFPLKFPIFLLQMLLPPILCFSNIIPNKLLQNSVDIKGSGLILTIDTLLITRPFSHSLKCSLLWFLNYFLYHVHVRLAWLTVEEAGVCRWF